MVLRSVQGRNQDPHAGAQFKDVSTVRRLARRKAGGLAILFGCSPEAFHELLDTEKSAIYRGKAHRKTRTYGSAKRQLDRCPYAAGSTARNGFSDSMPFRLPARELVTEAKRGALAIRALHRKCRAAAKKPKSLNEAVSNRMDEGLARLEADQMLKPPEKLVKADREVIDLGNLGFVSGYLADTLDNPNMISVDASGQRMNLAAGSGILQIAVDAAESAQAGNSLEKVLCHQMAAAHHAAMRLVARVGNGSLPIAEEARLSNAAARMMQVYQEAFLTLQKIRSGGRQTVMVQHVQVSDGGQAVIAGSVKGGGRKDRPGVDGKKGGYTP